MSKKSIPILMYHKFKDTGSYKKSTEVEKKRLEIQFRILNFLGYKTITFKEYLLLGDKKQKKKYLIITVDDGYKNNYDILFPLLKKYNIKATIYLTTGVDYNKWDVDEKKAKKSLLMNETEILEMHNSGLVEFGGHTLKHPSLPRIKKEAMNFEIKNNKNYIEKLLKTKVISFAYPYGHLNKDVKKIVKDNGYIFAVSTDTGSGAIDDDYFDIRRTGIDKTSFLDFFRKISPKYLIYKGKKGRKR